MKKIDMILKEQKSFIEQCSATYTMLLLYKTIGHKKFNKFLSDEIRQHYRIDGESLDGLWESCDEMMWDLFNKEKFFVVRDINDSKFLEFGNRKGSSASHVIETMEGIINGDNN
jgi:predicted nucleic acid-binding protein